MKNLLLILSICLFVISSFAQSNEHPITYKKNKFYQLDQKLTSKELRSILLNNPSSTYEFSKWRQKSNIGNVFVYAGVGFMTAGSYLLLRGSLQQTNDLNSGIIKNYDHGDRAIALGLAGLALEIVGIAIVVPARKKHLYKSIDQYNASINNVGTKPPVGIDFMANCNGFGVRLRF